MTTLGAVYDPVLSRIRLSATLLGATAVKADFKAAIPGQPLKLLRGGSGVTVAAQNANLDVYEFPPGVAVDYWVQGFDNVGVQTGIAAVGAFTQDVTSVWVKVVARPFLNRPVIVDDASPYSRPSRTGLFDVVGRSYPVAVSDLRGSRQYDLTLLTNTPAEERNLDLLIASGDPIYVQAPSTQTKIPGGEGTYWSIGTAKVERTGRISDRRRFTLPLTEVATPGPDVVGATGTWQTVVSTYATWTALLAAKATWSQVLELVGAPSEVIVP